jgi:hypothetical protein
MYSIEALGYWHSNPRSSRRIGDCVEVQKAGLALGNWPQGILHYVIA